MERAESTSINNAIVQDSSSSGSFPVYCPPEQFGIVEPGIYRSNMFDSSNFAFIKTLKLKSVILLSAELPTREIMQFLEERKIRLLHIGSMAHGKASGTGGRRYHSTSTQNVTTWRPISDEIVKESIETVLDSSIHPTMICCTTGIHETGNVVGCLRKLMGWNLNSIVVEYRSFAASRARYISEQFIELFDLDLITLPSGSRLPKWFPGSTSSDNNINTCD